MTPMRLSPILGILSLPFLNSCFASTTRNITIDDRDASIVLSPFPAWASSNQANGEQGGTFSFSNTENATVVFTFTQNVSAVSWQGFKRAGPALYSVCLDCTDLSQAQLVDGHDPDPLAINSLVTIFSTDVLPNDRQYHTLIITNLVDPRFGSTSQITVDSFILTCLASSWPMYPAVSASPVPSMPPMPDGASPSAAAYWSKSSSRTTLSTGVIVGIVFAVATALLGALFATWWLLRRRNGSGTMYKTVFRSDPQKRRPNTGDPESPMFSTLKIPPRNAEQASMVDTTVYSDLGTSKERGMYQSDRPQLTSSTSPLTHSTRPPSIRSVLSSILSREPSTRSTSAPLEWGTIPVVLKNPFASPHDADADTVSDFDFSTPLPSSELGSTFAADNEFHEKDDAYAVPAPLLREPAIKFTRPPMRSAPVWRRNEEESDGERTPTLTRGWRRVEV